VLTCKSLFGLGYRGERLIEPSPRRAAEVVESAAREGRALVGGGPLGRPRRDRQIAGTRRQAVGRARPRGNPRWHPG
jgi:hypothetical protein